MTQVMAPPCERCGAMLTPYGLVCTRCGGLAYRAELERLSQEAMALEPYDRAGAAQRWRQCLALLPPDSQQYAAIYQRISALIAGYGTPTPSHGAPQHHGNFGYPPPLAQAADDQSPTSAVVLTGGSMLLSILVYGGLMFAGGFPPLVGMQLAAGFVVLILVHELGHVAAMRYYGLSASPPIFIPFMGALINLRQPPQDAKEEAVVGIGGPIAGTIGALACYGLYLAMPHNTDAKQVTYILSYVGFILNLFNLLPVPPLDGGRITAAVSPKVWMLGIAGLIAMIANEFYQGRWPFLLVLVLLFALPRVRATLARRNVADPYYAISRRATWTIGVLYLVLGVLLLSMTWLTRDAFDTAI